MENKEIIQAPWFFETEEVLKKLETSMIGLTEDEAQNRLKIFGNNSFNKKKKINVIDLTIKQIMSPLIFILIGASILTGILQEWINMTVILCAILINVFLGVYREYQAENTLDKLVTYIKERSRVIRGGKEQEIDSTLIVPGDIIQLSYGSRVPADARVISINDFKVDEAILTGESLPIAKTTEDLKESSVVAERKNMVYAGTMVTEGFGTAVVVNTGEKTELGKIADLVLGTDKAKTPIQKGVNSLSWYIFALSIFIIIGIFVLGIFRGEPVFQMLILSAAVAVGAVPESLPIALTIILSVGAERIAKKKGVIRKLSAAETLGSATLIMTDKTGTLTKAQMQLTGVHTVDTLMDKYKESSVYHLSLEQKDVVKLALQNLDIIVKNQDEPEKQWDFSGRPFEVNIAKAGAEHNIPLKKVLIEENPLIIPFNSTNKYSVSKQDNENFVIMGAPDILLKMSNIEKDSYLKILSWIKEASENGKRLIAVGKIKTKDIQSIKNNEIKDIEFSGILSFFDPIREEVEEAVKNIESHGVKVVIITGDLKGTAVSVAKSLGWDVKDDEILTGEDIHQMTDQELLGVIQNIKIYARVTPEDKLRIGKLYRELGEIVGMTGDGVNDSPALKAMDIGISLGSGSDVAQSASDLVLLDDNFQTISLAIDEGRRIMSNIRKTFIYLMSNSLDEVFVVGGSLLLNIALPLTALQIIWVNLFTGSLPALAFAYDENLDKKSRKKSLCKNKLLNNEVKFLSFGIGAVTSFLIFFLYYILLKNGIEIKIARSIFFACFSVYVLVVSFSFRSLHKPIYTYNPFSNRKLNIAIITGILILIATMSIPFMQKLFDIDPLPISWLWVVIAWGIFNIALVEFAKWIFRHREKIFNNA